MQRSHAGVLRALNQGIEDGADPVEIYRGLVDYLRAALLVQGDLPAEFLDLGDEEIKKIASMKFSRDEIMRMLEILLHAEDSIKRSMNSRVATELMFFQLLKSIETPPAQQKDANPGDIKQEILRVLQVQSPKLAALVQNSIVQVDGSNLCIRVENDFSKTALVAGQGILEAVFKKVLKHDIAMNVEVADKKKENNLEETIRALFDGEEVR